MKKYTLLTIAILASSTDAEGKTVNYETTEKLLFPGQLTRVTLAKLHAKLDTQDYVYPRPSQDKLKPFGLTETITDIDEFEMSTDGLEDGYYRFKPELLMKVGGQIMAVQSSTAARIVAKLSVHTSPVHQFVAQFKLD